MVAVNLAVSLDEASPRGAWLSTSLFGLFVNAFCPPLCFLIRQPSGYLIILDPWGLTFMSGTTVLLLSSKLGPQHWLRGLQCPLLASFRGSSHLMVISQYLIVLTSWTCSPPRSRPFFHYHSAVSYLKYSVFRSYLPLSTQLPPDLPHMSPNFLGLFSCCLNNPLSPISFTCMCMDVGPSAGAWATHWSMGNPPWATCSRNPSFLQKPLPSLSASARGMNS